METCTDYSLWELFNKLNRVKQMKKIIAFILSLGASSILFAEEDSYLKDLQELQELAERAKIESQYYLDLKIHKMLMVKPKTFLTVLETYPNTYVWYIWNDFSSTKNSFKKIEILKELEQLNR